MAQPGEPTNNPQRNINTGTVTNSFLNTGDNPTFNFGQPPSGPPSSNSPDLTHYLRQMIDYTTTFLARRNPVTLEAEDTPTAIDSYLDWNERDYFPVAPSAVQTTQSAEPLPPFPSFEAAFQSYGQRMLLLGEPGAGKSTTLHQLCHQAAINRLNDPRQPIPVLVLLHRIKDIRFADLSAGALPALLQDTATRNGAILFHGHPLLYILDGLDEMGGERPIDLNKPDGKKFDSRAEFLQCLQQQLSDQSMVISCRVTDYNQLQQKVLLPGAVTLLPLSDQKIREFLLDKQNQPHLWAALKSDATLLDLARTPLLLALLSGGVGNSQEAINLNSAVDLIDLYIERRYEHEAAKHPLPFTLDETRRSLSRLAVHMWKDRWRPRRYLTQLEIGSVLGRTSAAFQEFACRLHLLVKPTDRDAIEFPHLAFRDRFAVPLFIQALKGKSALLRWRASRIFASYIVHGLLQALGVGYFPVRASAADALGLIGAMAVPALRQALGDPDYQVRLSAADALRRMGPAASEAIPSLIRALADQDKYVRSSAVLALSGIGAMAVPVLLQTLVDPDYRVRLSATDALRSIGPDAAEAIPTLIQALGDQQPAVRYWAAYVLGTVGPAAAASVSSLVQMLRDQEDLVRTSAASSLGDIGPAATEAIPALIQALRDQSAGVRSVAAASLGSIGATNEAIPALLQALGDHQSDVRSSAARALGRIGPVAVEIIPALIQALGDQDYPVRTSATLALGDIGPAATEAIPALIQALRDQNEGPRRCAASVLGDIGPAASGAIPALQQLANDRDSIVRNTASRALLKIQNHPPPHSNDVSEPEAPV